MLLLLQFFFSCVICIMLVYLVTNEFEDLALWAGSMIAFISLLHSAIQIVKMVEGY